MISNLYVTTGCDAVPFGRHQRFAETIILEMTKPLDCKCAVNMVLDIFLLKFRISNKTTRLPWGVFFLLDRKAPDGPTLQCDFIRLSKGYYHCYRLSSSRHRLLNLPDTRRTTHRWQSVGPALFGQARKKKTPYTMSTINNFRGLSLMKSPLPPKKDG